MAVRIRADGKIVCAAQSDAEPGDVYLDDHAHYRLATEMKVLRTDDEGETWYFEGEKLRQDVSLLREGVRGLVKLPHDHPECNGVDGGLIGYCTPCSARYALETTTPQQRDK